MNARDYMRQLTTLKKNRILLKALIDNCHIEYDPLHGKGDDGVRIQTSYENPMENAALEMLEKKRKYEEEYNATCAEIDKRLREINGMGYDEYSIILYMKYFQAKTGKEIAAKMNRSAGYVANLNTKALQRFANMYPESLLHAKAV